MARPPTRFAPALLAGLLVALAALAAPAGAAPAADVRGTWTVTGPIISAQPWRITSLDMATGALSGDGGPTNGYTWAITGSLDGSAITMTGTYQQTSYGVTLAGTVSPDGQSMSGTWSDTYGRTNQVWAATKKRPSGVRVTCNRGPEPTSDAQCTAEVGDGGPEPRRVPTGTVAWAATAGTFPAGSTCTLTPTPLSAGVAACGVTYRGGPEGIPAGVAMPVTATYAGDAQNASASGQHQLVQADIPTGSPPTPSDPQPGATAAATPPPAPPEVQDLVASCFFGGQAQQEVRRAFETECEARKRRRKEIMAAAATGFGAQSALSFGANYALKKNGKSFIVKALGRQVSGAAGGPVGEGVATVANVYAFSLALTEMVGYASGVAGAGTQVFATIDPPDPDYRTIPSVTPVLPARLLRLGAGFPAPARARLRAYARNQAEIAALSVALTTAGNRAGNALGRNDGPVVRAQLAAGAGFAGRLATAMGRAHGLARRALVPLRSLTPAARWRRLVSPARIAEARARVARQPIDPAAVARARRAGAPVAEVLAATRRRVRALPAAAMAADPITLALGQAAELGRRSADMRRLAADLGAG